MTSRTTSLASIPSMAALLLLSCSYARLQRQAASGDRYAQTRLCYAHIYGEGAALDYQKAYEYCRAAALQNDASSQTLFAELHTYGYGMREPDHETALAWYTKAAEQGHRYAELMMGRSYLQGLGVARDYCVARRWFERSAEHGLGEAKETVARLDREDAQTGRLPCQ